VFDNAAPWTIPYKRLIDIEQAALELSVMTENIFNASSVFYGFLCDQTDKLRNIKGAKYKAIAVEDRVGILGLFHKQAAECLPLVDIFLDYTQNAEKKANELFNLIEGSLAEEYKKEAAEARNSEMTACTR
jgi:hypothetical protein